MHPFEHRADTPVITGKDSDWVQAMRDLYLDVSADRRVLEIASNNGSIGREILKYSPRALTLLDPDPQSERVDDAEFVSEDVFKWLPTAPRYDVVVCFGLFYHLHNGLQLLEMMVNHCQPEYLILDSVIAPHPLTFNREDINTSGNRWGTGDWKCAPFNLNIPFHIFNESLDHMGYELTKTHKIFCNYFPKSNHWVGQWRTK